LAIIHHQEFKTRRLIAHPTCCVLLHNFVKNNVNYYHRIPINFTESTVVKCLTYHFCQNHTRNLQQILHACIIITTELLTSVCVQIAYVEKFAICGVIFVQHF